MTQEWPLQSNYDIAKEYGLWFFNEEYELWLTPEELKTEYLDGFFAHFDADDWQLRPPQEFLEQKAERLRQIAGDLVNFKERIYLNSPFATTKERYHNLVDADQLIGPARDLSVANANR